MPFNSCLCRRSPCRGSAAAPVYRPCLQIACTCWRCRIHRTGGGAGLAPDVLAGGRSQRILDHGCQTRRTRQNMPAKNKRRSFSSLSSFSWHSLHRAKPLLSRRVSDIWGEGYVGVPFAASSFHLRAHAKCRKRYLRCTVNKTKSKTKVVKYTV